MCIFKIGPKIFSEVLERNIYIYIYSMLLVWLLRNGILLLPTFCGSTDFKEENYMYALKCKFIKVF